MLKILILSASTGAGHMKTSHAVENYFQKNDIETKVVDVFKYISPLLDKTVNQGYKHLVEKLPNLFNAAYNFSNNKRNSYIIYKINSVISKKLLPLIENFKPNAIISTHPFTTGMVSNLIKKSKIFCQLLCIMTDYTPHITWIHEKVNAYIVSNESMIKPMIRMGVDEKIIHPIGIPIENSFYIKKSRNEILSKIDFNINTPTILMMAGSFAVNNIVNIYKNLLKIDKKIQIIIITGKNPKLYKTIKKIVYNEENLYNIMKKSVLKYISNTKKIKFLKKIFDKNDEILTKKTKILYYTNEVHNYMKIADIIITKPGGLTITEAIASGLPMVLFSGPRQEEENANFLISRNMAIMFEIEKNGFCNVSELLNNKQKLDSMRKACESFCKRETLDDLLRITQKILKNK